MFLSRQVRIMVPAVLVAILVAFAMLIVRNQRQGQCVDCIVEKSLSGQEYGGWLESEQRCEGDRFTPEDSTRCAIAVSGVPGKFDEGDAILGEIEIPSLRIFNTILLSKDIQAFIFMGEGCAPSLAVTSDGHVFKSGGCLG